ncbi:hypothetical protein V9K67_16995 [Paraflavisolibacter sp. H34]|uniref:hypothetical protein n=1 Tax=Huijunlia imazamoxiresistens TaxID=3127457 RepID=UPI00301A7BE2
MDLAFTIILKAGNRLREFNFTRTNQTAQGSYAVDVVHEDNRIYFHMNKKGPEEWEFIYPNLAPDWLVEAKQKLEAAIEEKRQPAPFSLQA